MLILLQNVNDKKVPFKRAIHVEFDTTIAFPVSPECATAQNGDKKAEGVTTQETDFEITTINERKRYGSEMGSPKSPSLLEHGKAHEKHHGFC